MVVKALILALQGDYQAHQKALETHFSDAEIILLRQEKDVPEDYIPDLFIIPGGESSTFSKIIQSRHLDELLRRFIFNPRVTTFVTCAGAILLAKRILNPGQTVNIPALDITIERNAYGRQIDSQIGQLTLDKKLLDYRIDPDTVSQDAKEAVFIRAPKIMCTGVQVEILATYLDLPVLVKENNIVAATFHPELSENSIIYRVLENIIKISLEVSYAE